MVGWWFFVLGGFCAIKTKNAYYLVDMPFIWQKLANRKNLSRTID